MDSVGPTQSRRSVHGPGCIVVVVVGGGTRDIGPVHKQLLLLFRRHVFPLVRDPIFRSEAAEFSLVGVFNSCADLSHRELEPQTPLQPEAPLMGRGGVQERVDLSTPVLGGKGRHRRLSASSGAGYCIKQGVEGRLDLRLLFLCPQTALTFSPYLTRGRWTSRSKPFRDSSLVEGHAITL